MNVKSITVCLLKIVESTSYDKKRSCMKLNKQWGVSNSLKEFTKPKLKKKCNIYCERKQAQQRTVLENDMY